MPPIDIHYQIKHIPKKPGVYLFRDEKGVLLYVGKAINLKNRVSSYFRIVRAIHESPLQPSPDLNPAKQLMVAHIHSIETTIVANETEALLLEAELIKRHHPPYNIILADDKSYVYIKFDFDRPGYPDVYPIRRPHVKRKSRSLLFGPYTSAMSAYTVLRLAKKIFPYCLKPPLLPPLTREVGVPQRKASRRLRGHGSAVEAESGAESRAVIPSQGESTASFRVAGSHRSRPCLNWHLHRCPGPCTGRITPEEYEQNLRHMIPLFQGTFTGLMKTLTAKMRAAAARKEFETAALARDQIRALKTVAEKQSIVDLRKESYDVIGLATAEDTSMVNIFRVRNGVLLERAAHPIRHPVGSSLEELLQSFLEQYYAYGVDMPRTIYGPIHVPSPLPHPTFVIVPQRGKKRRLLRLSTENAEEELKRYTRLQALKRSKTEAALTMLMRLLRLPKRPSRIEAYDISNVQGRHAVGAMTVALNGQPAPRDYRSFTIKTVGGSNDVAMLQEVLRRRLAHSLSHRVNKSISHKDVDQLEIQKLANSMTQRLSDSVTHPWPLPDLILIDGGKPQLSTAQQVLNEYGMRIPMIGIAKGRGLTAQRRRARGEEVWAVDQEGGYRLIDFENNNPARLLLDRVRDEAHRFGITHYRAKHGKALTTTRLDDIPGIGPHTRRILLQSFGSLHNVARASLSELSKLLGAKKAQKLRESFNH